MGNDESKHTKAVSGQKANPDKELKGAVSMALQKITTEEPSSYIDIHISCTNLPNTDLLSKTDPFAVLYIKDNTTNSWKILGYTEVISDTLNPKFIKVVTAKYLFEEKQLLKIEIYDQDNPNYKDLANQQFIGSAEFFIHDIVRHKFSGLHVPIEGKFKQGEVQLYAEISSNSNATITIESEFQTALSALFIVISKQKDLSNPNSDYVPIFKSEVMQTKISPKLKTIKIPLISDSALYLFEIFE